MQLPTGVHGLLWCILLSIFSWIGQTRCADVTVDGWVMKGYEMVLWKKDYMDKNSVTYQLASEAIQNQIYHLQQYQVIPFSNKRSEVERFYANGRMAKVVLHLFMPDSWSAESMDSNTLRTKLANGLELIRNKNGIIANELDVQVESKPTGAMKINIDAWVMKGYEMVLWNKKYNQTRSKEYLNAVVKLNNQLSKLQNIQIISFLNGPVVVDGFYEKDDMAKIKFHFCLNNLNETIYTKDTNSLRTRLQNLFSKVRISDGILSKRLVVQVLTVPEDDNDEIPPCEVEEQDDSKCQME